MSDKRRQEPIPAEQHTQDEKRVNSQLVAMDMTETARKTLDMFGFGDSSPGGRTSFEGYDLNAIIDLVENSDPEHLESAGEALWKARDAIWSAAEELGDHLDGVDWRGESGDAFRKWGRGLVAHARRLGDFAGTAGTQITVAGTGLASVRSAMPPRDSRLSRRSPEDIQVPDQVMGNPEYEAAVKAEHNRQEAINQINRLASYYAISGQALAEQEPPRFDKRLGVDVPRPAGGKRQSPPAGILSKGADGVSVSSVGPGSAARTAAGESGSVTATNGRSSYEVWASASAPDKSTPTEISGIASAPAPTTASGMAPAPSMPTGTGPAGGTAPPIVTGFVPPVSASSSWPARSLGMPRTVSRFGGEPGKASPAGGGPVAGGHSGTRVGRPGSMGGAPSATGRSDADVRAPAAGQSGVMGGRPMAAHAGTSAPSNLRTGQGNGIVGGTPQRTAYGTSSGIQSRHGTSPGTVIGGTGSSGGTPRPDRPGAPASGANGVVGAPRSTSESGSKGFTSGGAGLVRRSAGRRTSDREDEENPRSTRPDHLTEDEETGAARRRGAVPPVIDEQDPWKVRQSG
ncbi:hypothetical protein [Streptomyces sp. cmx-18-6]|uniref:hypothetical protein n=1 Tax=Streptomyces sp. cmx-18-6 TaxID=2790930 RepID=UPI00397FED0A